jgi:hypothetical protein
MNVRSVNKKEVFQTVQSSKSDLLRSSKFGAKVDYGGKSNEFIKAYNKQPRGELQVMVKNLTFNSLPHDLVHSQVTIRFVTSKHVYMIKNVIPSSEDHGAAHS